jgi:hypothetical protein
VVPSKTLKRNEAFRVGRGPTSPRAEFKASTEVTLRDDGTVSSGTLARDTTLDTMVGSGRLRIEFKGETPITFRDDGTASSGTLSHEVTLSTPQGRKHFTAGTQLRFAVDGSVET